MSQNKNLVSINLARTSASGAVKPKPFENWRHFPAVRQSFPAADYAPATGTIIFDIGGNKYRLISSVDFAEQLLFIQSVLTHEEYNREKF